MPLPKALRLNTEESISTIKMERSQNPNIKFVYVEGETDADLINEIMKKVLNNSDFKNAVIKCKNGKIKTLAVLNKAKEEKLKDVICCLDADFERLINPKLDDHSHDIIYTDQNDLETTILHLGVLGDNYLCQKFFNLTVLNDFLKKTNHGSLYDLLIDLASKIGWHRFQNHVKSLGLNFKDLPYDLLFAETNFEFNQNKLYECLIENIRNRPESDVLISRIQMLKWEKENAPDIRYCNGHDICHLISLINTRLGQNEKLRVIYKCEHIEADIRQWFSNNYHNSSMIEKLKQRLTSKRANQN